MPSRLRPSAPEASVHVLVPAHNEERSIGATIESLQGQTLPPASITVIADNCTDHTAGAAIIEGARVYASVGNSQKKAGALNQYLRRALLAMDPDDFVLVMDADSALDARFLEIAIRRLHANPKLGAVGGVFMGQQPTSVLEQLQANEYVRYARAVARKQGRVMVLTGTATVFRARALLQVAEARGEFLPGVMGDVYDTSALTEDNEITLALKHLGWSLVSPRECIVKTELMPTIGDLHRQRLRWYRGAVENLRTYGWTPVTKKYWIQQISLLACTFIFALFIAITAIDLSLGILRWSPWWSAVSLLFLAERLVTVWRVGSRGRLLAMCVIPEAGYDLLLQVTFVRATLHVLRGAPAEWSHVSVTERNVTAREQESHVPAQASGSRRQDQRRRRHPRGPRLHRA
jgi:cellulose synthase/poly-beta-1,6-N-acetylglucosamine synthase-like glycosyltransferase